MGGTVAPARTTFYGMFDRAASFGERPPFQLPALQGEEGRWTSRRHFDFISTADIIGGGTTRALARASSVGIVSARRQHPQPGLGLLLHGRAGPLPVRGRASASWRELASKVYGAQAAGEGADGPVASVASENGRHRARAGRTVAPMTAAARARSWTTTSGESPPSTPSTRRR